MEALWKLGGWVAEGGPPPATAALPGTAHLGVAFAAISRRRPVTFAYRGEQRRVDPWRLPLERLHGKIGDDGIERITTQTLFDILEIPQGSRGAGACRFPCPGLVRRSHQRAGRARRRARCDRRRIRTRPRCRHARPCAAAAQTREHDRLPSFCTRGGRARRARAINESSRHVEGFRKVDPHGRRWR